MPIARHCNGCNDLSKNDLREAVSSTCHFEFRFFDLAEQVLDFGNFRLMVGVIEPTLVVSIEVSFFFNCRQFLGGNFADGYKTPTPDQCAGFAGNVPELFTDPLAVTHQEVFGVFDPLGDNVIQVCVPLEEADKQVVRRVDVCVDSFQFAVADVVEFCFIELVTVSEFLRPCVDLRRMTRADGDNQKADLLGKVLDLLS